MKAYPSILVLSILASCGPAPEIEKRAPLFTSSEKLEVLSEKADKDIITTKFKDNIGLKCNFVIDDKKDAKVSLQNSFFFDINLAKNHKPINLSMKFGEHSFVVGFRIREFDILPENKVPRENGAVEVMKNSPVVKLLIRGREIRGNFDKKYDRDEVINEKTPLTITNLFPAKYPHILNCELKTEIAPEYASDYVLISPEVETPPVTETEIDPEASEPPVTE